jgi:aspartyl/asparaginyl-tRNA synthetase
MKVILENSFKIIFKNTDVFDVMELADDYMKFVISFALENCKSELEFFEKFKEME